MKKDNVKIILNIIIALVIAYFIYTLINDEFKQNKASNDFCKQQCNYNPNTKTWDISMKWFFDENEVISRIETEKSFPEKEQIQCINYCKNDLQDEVKYLTQDPPDSRPY